MRHWCTAVAVTAAMAVAGCGSDLPTEADLPPEAELAPPGSDMVDRNFDEGETGTYIDGGSADRAPRLSVTYAIDDMSGLDVIDWYDTALAERGWTLDRRSDTTAEFTLDPDGDLIFGIGVLTLQTDTAGTFNVITVVDRDE